MIRNLKALIVAAMALAALGAFGASGAQAAEFHCSVEPCTFTAKADGTGKTAHHVLIIKRAGVAEAAGTCNSITGDGTSNTKTTANVTLTGISYGPSLSCTLAGSPATVLMNSCEYFVISAGKISVRCPVGKKIELVAGKCIVTFGGEIGGENQNLSEIKYHNIGAGATTEVTAEAAVKSIRGEVNAECVPLGINKGVFTEGEYTTGSTIVTAESHAGVMTEGWWQ